MADLAIAGGASPPSYDEAITSSQYEVGEGSSCEPSAPTHDGSQPSDLPVSHTGSDESGLDEKQVYHGDPPSTSLGAPSAPPLSEIADQEDLDESELPATVTVTSSSEGPAVPRQPAAASQSQNIEIKSTAKVLKLIKIYIGYSMAQKLRVHIEPDLDEECDPDLDYVPPSAVASVRKAADHRSKLQCLSAWIWFFGGLQVVAYLGLPVAMLITGIVAADHDKCPYNSGRIITYLIIGGALLLVMTIFRILPSMFTCCMNRDICNKKDSLSLAAFIGILEIFFYVFALANLAVLISGTVWIFESRPESCMSASSTANATIAVSTTSPSVITTTSTESMVGVGLIARDCCERAVYNASAFFNIFQYILHALTIVYLSVTGACIKWMATYK